MVNVTHVPSAGDALRTFLDAMVANDYTVMYAQLTQASQKAISETDFAKRYTDDLNALSAKTIEYNILSMLTDPQNSQVSFHITYHTGLFGDIQRDFNTTMVLENGTWRIPWDDSLILPELAGGKHLATTYDPPARGDIYDRNGNAIAAETDAYAIGLVAGEVSPDNEGAVIRHSLPSDGRSAGYHPEQLRKLCGWKLCAGGRSQRRGSRMPRESPVTAVSRSARYTSRFYEPNMAPNAVGYTLFISPEDYNAYRRLGYSGAERIGWEGIEKWGENYLHGQNAAKLYVTARMGPMKRYWPRSMPCRPPPLP